MRALAALLITLACTGCGPIIAGAVLATDSSGGGGGAAAPPGLTAPASIARPLMVNAAGAPSASEVRVDYSLVDPGAGLVDVTVQWKRATDGDGSFRPATAATGSEPVTGLSSAADPGALHRFVWAAATDLASAGLVEEDVVLRLQPTRAGNAGTARDVALRVGNTAPSVVLEAVSGVQGRTVLTAMTVRDSSLDDSTIQLAVRPVASTSSGTVVVNLNVGANVPTIVAGSSTGARATVAWNSIAAFGISNLLVEVIATATDRYGLTAQTVGTIDLRNDTPPAVQILSVGTATGIAKIAGRVPIRFALFDSEADPAIDPSGASGRVDVTIEVSGDNGVNFRPATGLQLTSNGRPVGVRTLNGLAALPPPLGATSATLDPPNVHTFIWDALADGLGPGEKNIVIRVTPRSSLVGAFARSQRVLGEAAPLFDARALLSVTGSLITDVTTGDLNEDGVPDLVFARYGDGEVRVQLGLGDGTFGPQRVTQILPVGLPHEVQVADMNGDGHLDVVTANTDGQRVNILYGDGTGDFASQIQFTFFGGPNDLVIADFDSDGLMDIVATSGDPTFGGNAICLSQGSSPGVFTDPIPVTPSPYSIAVGDLNGDGRLDIAFPNSTDLSVMYGVAPVGTVVFGLEQRYLVGSQPRGVAVADLNGDGFADVVVTNEASNDLSLLFGSASGLGAETRLPLTGGPTSVTVADMDGDGVLDLVVAVRNASELAILRGRGDGTFTDDLRSPDRIPTRIALADLDGDGCLDALTTSSTNSIIVRRSSGGTGFGAEARLPSSGSRRVLLGDLNGDGLDDQVVLDEASAVVHLGGIGGAFGDPLPIPVPEPGPGLPPSLNGGALGDLDGDGRLDIVLPENATGRILTFLGAGDGTFGNLRTYVTFFTSSLAVGDLNGDGLADVVQQSPNQILVYLAGAGGDLGSPTPSPGAVSPAHVLLEDIDRDGRLDVVTANFFDFATSSASVVILKGDGAGALSPLAPTRLGNAGVMAIADLDADGWPDLVVADAFVRNLAGTLSEPVTIVGTPSEVTVGDVDGDGSLDVVWADGAVLTNPRPATFGPPARGDGRNLGAPAFAVRDLKLNFHLPSVASTDVTADGVADIVAVSDGGTLLLVSAAIAPSTTASGFAGRVVAAPALDLALVQSFTATAGMRCAAVSTARAYLPQDLLLASPLTIELPLATGLTSVEMGTGVFRVFRYEPEDTGPPRYDPVGRRIYGRTVEVARSGGGPGLGVATVDGVKGTISFATTRLGRFQTFLEVPATRTLLFRETFDAERPDTTSREAPLPFGWHAFDESFANWRAGIAGASGPASASAPNVLAIGLARPYPVVVAGAPQLIQTPSFSVYRPGARTAHLRFREWHDFGASGDAVQLVLYVGGTASPVVVATFAGTSAGPVALASVDLDVTAVITAQLDALGGPPFKNIADAWLELRLVNPNGGGRGFFIDDLELVLE